MSTPPLTARTIPQLFAERATSAPEHRAVVTPQATLTYRAVDEQAASLAARLLAMGVRKGTVVALLAPNGTTWVCWWLTCARLGAIVVPINTFATSAEVHRILVHSGAHVLVAVPEFGTRTYRGDLADILGPSGPDQDRICAELPQLRRTLWLDDVAAPQAAGTTNVLAALASDVDPSDVLTIIYSSGSTGDPKGVVHTHGSTVRQARRMAEMTATEPATVLWTSMPLNWVGGLVWSFLRAAVAGATFVTQDRMEPEAALQLFVDAGVTTITAWGPVAERLRAHPSYSDESHGHIHGLAVAGAGGESRPGALGMTETLGPHSGWILPDATEPPPEAVGSCGRALPGMEHRVVDPDSGIDVSDGVPGELWVRGDSLMVGLHKRERAQVFTPGGWYPTRDQVVLRDGWLFFQGRLDDVIKTAGANVSPTEVRAVLEAHPAVEQAFVVGVPEPARGHDVAAVLVPASESLDVDAVLTDARRRLASYKVPRRVRVVREEELPRLSSQKIDLRRLRAFFTDP